MNRFTTGSVMLPRPRVHPISTAEYFDRRASAYSLAQRKRPFARLFELLPFLALRSGCKEALDVFCGTGFLTGALRSMGSRVTPMDLRTEMLEHSEIAEPYPIAFDSLDDLGARIASRSGVDVLSLAGFHHCYRDDELEDGSPTPTQRGMLRAWTRATAGAGRIVLLDVTDTDSCECIPALDALKQAPLGVDTARLLSPRAPGADAPWAVRACVASTLGEVVSGMGDVEQLCRASSPSSWFREVVAKYSEFGHEDRFVSPHDLVASARNECDLALMYCEWPSPWVFPSRDDVIEHFSRFFQLPPEAAVRGIDDHLGWGEMPCGAVAIGWRLGCFWSS